MSKSPVSAKLALLCQLCRHYVMPPTSHDINFIPRWSQTQETSFLIIFRCVSYIKDDGRSVCGESAPGPGIWTTEPSGDCPGSGLSPWSGSLPGPPEPRGAVRNSAGREQWMYWCGVILYFDIFLSTYNANIRRHILIFWKHFPPIWMTKTLLLLILKFYSNIYIEFLIKVRLKTHFLSCLTARRFLAGFTWLQLLFSFSCPQTLRYLAELSPNIPTMKNELGMMVSLETLIER